MAYSKKLQELNEQIQNEKQSIINLIEQNKVEEAKNSKTKLEELKTKFDLLFEVENQEENKIINLEDKKEVKTLENRDTTTVLAGVIKNVARKRPVNSEDVNFLNSQVTGLMKEAIPEDGGLIVPSDIQTKILEMRRSKYALENYVRVEKVSLPTGSRVLEKNTEKLGFVDVEEGGTYTEMTTPKFDIMKYAVKKMGGIMSITKELLNDTPEALIGYVNRWIADKSRISRNNAIIKKLNEIVTADNTRKCAIVGIDSLKDVFNVKLDPAISSTSVVITNQDGFNYLDKLKDSDGRYLLQTDPTNATIRRLFGRYEVVMIGNDTLETKNNKIPMICGDLKEALVIFDQWSLEIDTSSEGLYFSKDLIGIKARERFDIQAFDTGAFIWGEIDITPTTKARGVKNNEEVTSS